MPLLHTYERSFKPVYVQKYLLKEENKPHGFEHYQLSIFIFLSQLDEIQMNRYIVSPALIQPDPLSI